MATEAITFLVPGAPVAAEGVTRGAAAPALPAGLLQGRLKHSVRVGAQRGGTGVTRVTAVPGEDVVVIHIANGPELVLHPETARDLMLAQGERKRERGGKGADGSAFPDEVAVPVHLRWRGLEKGLPARGATRGATRGALGDVLATGFDVVTGVFKDKAADLVATAAVKRIDSQVDPGVYALSPETLRPLKGSGAKVAKVPGADGPILVLIHGTFVETTSTFGKLWIEHPQRVRALFDHYAQRVYALDHPTLGVSPIANALTLAQSLPKGARLHLVTHSRGGLVAEVLARVCGSPELTDEDLERFAGTPDAGDLAALAALVKKLGVRVERIVRVACPARGTLLASKRLDAYVSVFKWTLQLAGVPVAPQIVDFLGEVAQRRRDKSILPGLEAQIPDSALVQWLHALEEQVPGELRVVAGDLQGDSVTSWVKTLLADAFYWTDNDLVVQTRSMYGGAPRAEGATFVLDQGGKVSHFAYFSNERSAEAIVAALINDTPAGFRTIGPLSWAGKSATGVRARAPTDGRLASELPAVFVLPGILGSNLKVGGKRIWLGWRIVNGLRRLEYQAVQPDGVEPDGPIENIYDDLIEYLAKTHEVIDFGYDWRRPIEDEARRLAAAVDAALTLRDTSGQPVCLIAHSMGGLVARTMQLEAPQVWSRMMARAGARLLMLGTPNGGSWAPMQVLSGDDTFGNLLVGIGAPFQDRAAREMMAQLPGFLQLQRGLRDAALGLDREATWQKLADDDLAKVNEFNFWHRNEIQVGAYRWGVPRQAVLDRAKALRERLDNQLANDLRGLGDRLVLVVGKSRFTPDGFEIAEDGLFYLNAPDVGDGRVTLASALLPGVRTWQIDVEHGKLPEAVSAFDGYLDLLQRGDTTRLPRLPDSGTQRGAAELRHVRSRPSREQPIAKPPGDQREVYALSEHEPRSGAMPDAPLNVSVVNGDLMFVRQPLMVGHYRSLRLTGTERVVDRLVDRRMESSLRVGAYADAAGSHEIFVNTSRNPANPLQMPRPEAVIVVGLGEEGKLRAVDLAFTVRQGVIEWSRRSTEQAGVPASFEVAATLIGSGGTGISPGQAAQLVAQGVSEANEKIAEENRRHEGPDAAGKQQEHTAWPTVSHLHLIELYLERASEAWRALHLLSAGSPGKYLVTDAVQTGVGGLRRPPDASYRGTDYDFISAITQFDSQGGEQIAYAMDTRRARTEVRAQAAQGMLLKELVKDASNAENTDPQIGRSLFQLLVPLELEPFLGGTTDMVLELDQGTAGIPWELLDTNTGTRGSSDPRPWAIRTKLLRKLRTVDYRLHVTDASPEAHVLVIGEPKCDAKLYPPLPGAYAEALAVAERLARADALPADRVTRLLGRPGVVNDGADARTVVNALLERDWRIVHIAGHGEPPLLAGPEPATRGAPAQKLVDPRGVVLSGGVFLGPREIQSMRVVPELVFVNCCHLAAVDQRKLLAPYNRPGFAASVAEKLIDIGVRCVVAAGWAVEDEPAKVFATTFYDAVLQGRRFIEAVAQARDAAWALGGNTWAAYQCYGDPDWLLRAEPADAQRPSIRTSDKFAGVASPASLVLALDTLAVESKYQRADPASQKQKIAYLEVRFGSRWGSSGEVAEAFAKARAEAGDEPTAIDWYEKALKANDGTASLKSSEQLGNLRVRVAETAVNKAGSRVAELQQRLEAVRGGRSESRKKERAKLQGELVAARTALGNVARDARHTVTEAIAQIKKLLALQPTMERESICGSAYKRLALLEAQVGNADAKGRAIAEMEKHYRRAETLGREARLADTYYPAMNRLAAEIVANAGRPKWKGLDPTEVTAIHAALATKARDDPDFWSVVGITELRVYEALSRRALAAALPEIERDYADLYVRVGTPGLWRSVYDQARFLLADYRVRATDSEKAAAESLLNRLASMVKTN